MDETTTTYAQASMTGEMVKFPVIRIGEEEYIAIPKEKFGLAELPSNDSVLLIHKF